MSHVLVVFQANTEHVEQMALAVAVGAVEAEGLIRLRRLAADGAPQVGHKSYGRLQATDLSWATTIVVGLEDRTITSNESGTLISLLSQVKLPGTRAWTFNSEGLQAPHTPAQIAVEKAFIGAEASLLKPQFDGDSADLLEQMKQIGRSSGRSVEKT